MSNEISLQQAIDMTTRFRGQNTMGGKITLSLCETFDRAVFDKILSQAGCVKMRIYSGLDANNVYRSIIVGVDANDMDLLPATTSLAGGTADGTGTIGEDGNTCPPFCPPPSPLNP